MSNLKVGMRVKAVTDYPENSNKRIIIGDFGSILDIDPDCKDLVRVRFDNKSLVEYIYAWRVEPVREEPKQMKPTDKITVEITLAELAKIYAIMGECYGLTPNTLWNYACDLFDPDQLKHQDFLEGKTSEEILSFGPYEDEFLALIFNNKSPQQIKIEELQATIDKACQEIKELREMGGNK